jgi:hypothetical protein
MVEPTWPRRDGADTTSALSRLQLKAALSPQPYNHHAKPHTLQLQIVATLGTRPRDKHD